LIVFAPPGVNVFFTFVVPAASSRGCPTRDGDPTMAEFKSFDSTEKVNPVVVKSSNGTTYVDYRAADDLRRFLTPNGKIQSRKRTGLNAREQRMVANAVKRARYMGLMPYTSATL